MSEKAPGQRLLITKFKLNSLLEITRAINENPSREKLLSRYESILRDELKIGKVAIFKHSENWECILCTGLNDPSGQISIDAGDLLHYDEISFIRDPDSPLHPFDFVIPVIRDNQHLAVVLIGDIDEECEGVSPVIKHLNFIQTLSNIIIVAIENIRLYEENIRQAAIRKELELAARLQSMLIPDPETLPSKGPLAVSAFYHPHMDVGGDYYDFIRLGPDEYGFCICDVAGKGISAAMIMSNFQANLRALFNREIRLERLVSLLNDRVNQTTMGERFLTMFIGKYHSGTRELVYVNAGHNPPLVYCKESGSLSRLDSTCLGIGMVDEMPAVEARKLRIGNNIKLLCYTDGLVEILNEDLVETETGVIEFFLSNNSPICENIKDIVNHHTILEGNNSIIDDITILGFEFD